MTSASFKLSGNSLFNKVLLKSICIVLAVACTLGQSIFGGILLFVVALFGFRRLISFLTGDKVNGTKRKISVLRILFLIIKILGWQLCFTIIISLKWWMFLFLLLTTNEFSFIFKVEARFFKKSFINVSQFGNEFTFLMKFCICTVVTFVRKKRLNS